MTQPPPQPRSCCLCFTTPCVCCPDCCRPRGAITIIPPCVCEDAGPDDDEWGDPDDYDDDPDYDDEPDDEPEPDPED